MRRSFLRGILLRALSLILLVGGSISIYANSQSATPSAGSDIGKDEHQIIINVPPENWNPVTATDEELQKYAYPPRPKDATALEEWKKVVGGKWVYPVIINTHKRISSTMYDEIHQKQVSGQPPG